MQLKWLALDTGRRDPKHAGMHASMYMYTHARGTVLYSFQRAFSAITSSDPLNNGDPAHFPDE